MDMQNVWEFSYTRIGLSVEDASSRSDQSMLHWKMLNTNNSGRNQWQPSFKCGKGELLLLSEYQHLSALLLVDWRLPQRVLLLQQHKVWYTE
jgi:hypothetical protein